jgi:cytochrome c556
MSKSKLFIIAGAVIALAVPSAALAAKPGEVYNAHDASVNNTNANEHAVWGQDRSFYASEKYFGANMDIKQSFPTDLGGVGEQRAAWVAEFGS